MADTVTERLAKIRKQQAETAPSMVPDYTKKRGKGWAKKPEEVIPDAEEYLIAPQRKELITLVGSYHELGAQITALEAIRGATADRIKQVCEEHTMEKVRIGDYRLSYARVPRSSIKKEELLAKGVTPGVIAACTLTTYTYQIRVSKMGAADE